MKKYYFLAASLMALTGCTSDDFAGNGSAEGIEGNNVAIKFDGNAGRITRATSNTGTFEEMLDGQFLVYGVKSGATAGSGYQDVFQNYSVWDGTVNSSASNTNGWKYVGAKDATGLGTGNITLAKDQTIKYWDYSATDYRFVAGSPISAITFTQGSDKSIESATISGLAGHIKANTSETALATYPIYVANPVVVEKANYKDHVMFHFVRQQAMVRVGIYETIPGYSISEIKFYKQGDTALEADGNNVVLTNSAEYFVGGTDLQAKITYNWTNKTTSFSYEGTPTTAKNWYGGAFANGIKATSSVIATDQIATLFGTDKDMASNGYFTVLPTAATTASALLIKCDYTLTSDDGSGETICVKGATAAIPAAFSKWDANTQYTYIFKISQNTNGYTGSETAPAGLYPITFAAMTANVNNMGTTTTFTTPSITTYQQGSVTTEGVKYLAGKAIEATVCDATTGAKLTLKDGGADIGAVAVYKLSKAYSEAELQIENIKLAELTDGNKKDVTITDNVLSFTPADAGTYAIQYRATASAFTYKIVTVEAAE